MHLWWWLWRCGCHWLVFPQDVQQKLLIKRQFSLNAGLPQSCKQEALKKQKAASKCRTWVKPTCGFPLWSLFPEVTFFSLPHPTQPLPSEINLSWRNIRVRWLDITVRISMAVSICLPIVTPLLLKLSFQPSLYMRLAKLTCRCRSKPLDTMPPCDPCSPRTIPPPMHHFPVRLPPCAPSPVHHSLVHHPPLCTMRSISVYLDLNHLFQWQRSKHPGTGMGCLGMGPRCNTRPTSNFLPTHSQFCLSPSYAHSEKPPAHLHQPGGGRFRLFAMYKTDHLHLWFSCCMNQQAFHLPWGSSNSFSPSWSRVDSYDFSMDMNMGSHYSELACSLMKWQISLMRLIVIPNKCKHD